MSQEIIQFIKMEGTGNDYIYLDATGNTSVPEFSAKEISQLSHRRYGIGSDGLVIIAPSKKADGRMFMWNSDGTPSSMCGNALRCVAYLLFRKTGKRELSIESGAGIHRSLILSDHARGAVVEVEMGSPRFLDEAIPFLPGALTTGYFSALDPALVRIIQEGAGDPADLPQIPERLGKSEGLGEFHFTALSMGNPHMVIFLNEIDSLDLDRIGPELENHPAFPQRVNVEYVRMLPDGTIAQRTFERGSGETDACGSGACAVLAASVVSGRGPRENTIHLRGGDLYVSWRPPATVDSRAGEFGTIFLKGDVRETFQGSFVRPIV